MIRGVVIFLFVLAAGGGPARKVPLSIADMADSAELICIGRVEEIVAVPVPKWVVSKWVIQPGAEVPIARVTVERVLKGAENTTVLHHEAWRTWACDDTAVEVDQRALLFLSRNGEIARAPESVRSSVRNALGSVDVFRNLGSGDGIRTIVIEGGDEFIGEFGAPRALEDGRPRLKLAEVLQFIEELCRFPLDSVSVHARDEVRSPGSVSFDLRILPDGKTRLTTGLGGMRLGGAATRVFTLEPKIWRPLEQELALLTGGQDRVVGDTSPHYLARKLVLRAHGSTLTFAEPHKWSPPQDDDLGQRLALEDALRAWTLVRELAALSDPDPHAEKDRLWLGY